MNYYRRSVSRQLRILAVLPSKMVTRYHLQRTPQTRSKRGGEEKSLGIYRKLNFGHQVRSLVRPHMI
jgi:hypothetical protein